MKKPDPFSVKVVSSTQISPNVQRITLQGNGLAKFADDCAGSYIKLLFTASGNTDISQLGDQRPTMRTYTIRSFNKVLQSIEVDFVRHITQDLQCGFAARWAMEAKLGDSISIVGPGSISNLNHNADWFFTVADLTSLPALSVKLSQLPLDAKGYAVIKVVDKADIQPLTKPELMKIFWLTEQDSIIEKVRSLPWLEGQASVWAACEFDSMKALRTYFRNEKSVGREHIYISSYWKLGVAEDGHKVLKQQDASENS